MFSSNVQLYLPLASGTLLCSVKSQLMTSRAVGTGMLVKRADTLKETSSNFPKLYRSEVFAEPLLSLTNVGLYLCTFGGFSENLANWYVTVPQAETMGCM